MGIARGALRLLLDEKKKGVLKGEKILQLGRQCVLFDYATVTKYARKHHVQLSEVEPQLSSYSHYKKKGFIDDITLFKSLGFKQVHSLDYSDFEGADITWDLNMPVPEKYWGQFDIIYDGGTVEHVFNFPQVLANIYRLLKVGGQIIHVSPSHNHVDHGFYMFSPQLYFEYYRANEYQIMTSQIFEYSPKYNGRWHIYDYQPDILSALSGGFGTKMLAIHLIAQKKVQSTFDVVPQQKIYVKAWQSATESQVSKRHSLINSIKMSLRKKMAPYVPYRIKFYIKKRKMRKLATY